MPGPSMKVNSLQELMCESVGQRGLKDLKDYWFEHIYGIIREHPWPWNFNKARTLTFPSFTSTETFTWTLGQNWLQSSVAITTFQYLHTGRYVLINDTPYRIIRVDLLLDRLYLDSKVSQTNTTPTKLTYFRTDLCLKTSSIRDVSVDGSKLLSISIDRLYNHDYVHENFQNTSGGTSYGYMCDEHTKIQAPGFPPALVASVGGGIEAGEYRYFWTYIDNESGLESAPGPEFVYANAGATQITVNYENPSDPNRSEFLSYKMRLWRSVKNVGTDRYPAFLVAEKDPGDNAIYMVDNYQDRVLITREKYYDGNQTLIRFTPWPDGAFQVDCVHVNDWGRRPYSEEYVDVGKNNAVVEMLALGASMFVELSARDLQSSFAANMKFRQQLAYLLRKTVDATDGDPGIGSHSPISGVVPDSYYTDPVDTFTWRR